MAPPLVSVVMPVYNGERHLAEAMESVLAQSYPSLELIVVDDGSTDGSAAVARSREPRVRVVAQPNQGTGAARNLGIRQAAGVFLAHLDADDLWPPDSLALRMAAFAARPELDIVSGQVQSFHSPETDTAFRQRVHCPPGPLPGQVPGSMVVRRDAFLRVGWFETRWRTANDMSWYLRAVEAGLAMLVLPDLVLRRRLHAGNRGLVHGHLMPERLRILKAALDRRRAPAPGKPCGEHPHER